MPHQSLRLLKPFNAVELRSDSFAVRNSPRAPIAPIAKRVSVLRVLDRSRLWTRLDACGSRESTLASEI